MHDVIEHPSEPGLALRRDQLERDRYRLLKQLELEQVAPTSPPPPPRPPRRPPAP